MSFFAGGFSQTAVFAQSKKQKALEQQRTKLQKRNQAGKSVAFQQSKERKKPTSTNQRFEDKNGGQKQTHSSDRKRSQ